MIIPTVAQSVAQFLVIISGIWLVAISVIMLVSPQTAKRYLGKAASTNFINYLELSLRGIWGIALVLSAALSKFPEIFQTLGLFVVVTTAILFLVPRRWHARYAVWWSNKLTAPHIRIASPFSLAFAIFLIYAVV